jgi:hypothetical protein
VNPDNIITLVIAVLLFLTVIVGPSVGATLAAT